MSSAITINNLSVQLQGKLLLDAFSLNITSGEKVTIAGPSGSGKSTLLRCIMGFMLPSSGAIEIFGEGLDADTVWRLRGKMAYVAQEPELGEGIVRDALQYPFTYKINRGTAYSESKAVELFERFMLNASFLDKDIGSLSGGEKQRIALVIALSLKRPLLLLDEAASALDSTSKKAVREYLCHCDALTILSVSHDIRDFSLSERMVTLPFSGKGVET